jgi:hypothetical protein
MRREDFDWGSGRVTYWDLAAVNALARPDPGSLPIISLADKDWRELKCSVALAEWIIVEHPVVAKRQQPRIRRRRAPKYSHFGDRMGSPYSDQ